MRLIVVFLCALLLFPPTVLGKSLYVSSYREVMLRTGPSLQNKILAILKTGQEVSLVSEEGDYYFVTLPNGTKGYILKNYMTDQAPAETRLQELEQQTQQRIKELEAQTQEQEKELAALREERAQLQSAKQQAEATTKQQAEATAKQQAEAAARLQTERPSQPRTGQSVTEHGSALQWFITGAGVLLTGLILGWVWGATWRRNRRRSGLSLNRF